MPYRDILVVIEKAGEAAQRLGPAASLAERCGARLDGMFATGYPIAASYGDVSGWMQIVDAYLAAQREEAGKAETAYRTALSRRGLAGEWLYREADETDTVLARAALYDLIVIGQPDPDAMPAGSFGLRPDEVVLGCGRPVLVVPYAGSFAEVGRRVLVAWNGRREAARALHDAMPLLEAAEAVTVIQVDPPAEGVAEPAVGAVEVAAALARRGVAATAETATSEDIGIDDLLLSRAADLAAELLVMGAYGHSRMREFVLGGVSRGIFQHMTVPVLMAH